MSVGLTFRDLIIRVAEANGWGVNSSGTANATGMPTSQNILDKVKRAINDGRMRMYRDHPKWHGMKPRITVSLSSTAGSQTVDGDTSKVLLSPSLSIVVQEPWTWQADEEAGARGTVQFRSAGDVDRLHAASGDTLTGHPMYASITPQSIQDAALGVRPQLVLRVYPRPDKAYTLHGQGRLVWRELLSLADCEPLGPLHDLTVVAAANWVLNERHPDAGTRQRFKDAYVEALAASIRADEQNALGAVTSLDEPSTTVGMSDGMAGSRYRVTHVNGIALEA